MVGDFKRREETSILTRRSSLKERRDIRVAARQAHERKKIEKIKKKRKKITVRTVIKFLLCVPRGIVLLRVSFQARCSSRFTATTAR